MIDWEKPLRRKADRVQVYLVGARHFGSLKRYTIGLEDRWGSGGVEFTRQGELVSPAPGHWNELENFDPIAELMAGMEVVSTPQQRKESEAMLEDARDNPLFGAFG